MSDVWEDKPDGRGAQGQHDAKSAEGCPDRGPEAPSSDPHDLLCVRCSSLPRALASPLLGIILACSLRVERSARRLSRPWRRLSIEEHTPAAALQHGLRCRACVDGLLVAGVPIGTPAFQTAYAQSVLNAHEAAHAQLREMGDAQAMYLLLRYCLSARLTYLLRALSPAVMAPVAAASDATTVYALRRYLIR